MEHCLSGNYSCKSKFIVIFFLILPFFQASYAQNNKHNAFVVVLDAGHGGKDPGNMGNGFKEKEIALQIVLNIGKELDKHPGVQVLYTRTKDVFVTLKDRAEIANDAKADLFVSVHLNAFRTGTPHGAETYVLGTYRNKDNLDVAMRENSVIYLEDDYEETYDGFDPKSPESYIGMTLMQEEYLDQSIVLADFVQHEFTTRLKRYNRGVKKAGFLVLRETYMPSVLIETGFLTNLSEGRYLNAASGQQAMAKAISDGIVRYKNTLNLEDITKGLPVTTDVADNTSKVTYRIQVATSRRNLKTLPQNFKGLRDIEKEREGEVFRYYYGNTTDPGQARDFLNEVKKAGYHDAFVVKVEDGQK